MPLCHFPITILLTLHVENQLIYELKTKKCALLDKKVRTSRRRARTRTLLSCLAQRRRFCCATKVRNPLYIVQPSIILRGQILRARSQELGVSWFRVETSSSRFQDLVIVYIIILIFSIAKASNSALNMFQLFIRLYFFNYLISVFCNS